MAEKVGFITEQGGVGKTSLCFNIAWELSKNRNKKVLMIDVDPQGGNLSFFGGIKKLNSRADIGDILKGEVEFDDAKIELASGLDIIPANEKTIWLYDILNQTNQDLYAYDFAMRQITKLNSLTNKEKKAVIEELLEKKNELESEEPSELKIKRFAQSVQKKYDYIFFDINPTPSLIHMAVLYACDNIIIPADASYKTVESTKHVYDSVKAAKKHNPKLKIKGVVYNKPDASSNHGGKMLLEFPNWCGKFGIDFIKTTIPKNCNITDIAMYHQGVTTVSPRSSGARAIRQLVDELFGKEG